MRCVLLLPLLTTVLVGLSGQSLANRSFTGAEVLEALTVAYPHWVVPQQTPVGPGISVDGNDFVWAEGRLLPPSQQGHWSEFAPQPFFDYPSGLPEVADWPDERIAEAEKRLADRRSNHLRRESAFFDALWSVHDRTTADAAQKPIIFLGHRVTVHQSLVAPLARIESQLGVARRSDPSLDAFLKNLSHWEGYNWRDIAETQSRSNHSYGSALDLIPRDYGGKNPYWLWAHQDQPGWYRTAWVDRWEPHPAVVQAFEREGFVWGGKWLLFDTIHFEYRPEILLLNGLR